MGTCVINGTGVMKFIFMWPEMYRLHLQQEAQLSLTNRAMLVCKLIEVWQDILSEYVDKKFTYICYRWCHAPDCQELT